MRFFYVDFGLRSDAGHAANCCRPVAAELRKRNIPLTIYGFSGVTEALRVELGILPVLRTALYYLSDGDPRSGWLNAFKNTRRTVRQDLEQIADVHADDIVYLASAFPGQLMGAIEWLDALPQDRRPFVLVDLLGHPGVWIQPGADGNSLMPWDEDPRATLYHYAGTYIAKRNLRRLTVSYTDPMTAAVYSRVIGVDVVPLPLPFQAVTSCRNRAGTRPLHLAFLGHQRNGAKGYQLVPDVVDGVLKSHPDVRVHVHNSLPADFPAAHAAMRAFAKTRPNVFLEDRLLDTAGWAQILDATDLIVCPYSPSDYSLMSSGIHAEAIANAIPTVVPAHTALSRALKDYGDAGIAFETFEPSSILAATRSALDGFDLLAEKAVAASVKWRQTAGPENLVDAILAMAAKS